MSPWYAHARAGTPPEEWEPLECHLTAVADKAAAFAEIMAPGLGAWGSTLGFLHDVGKARPEFIERLRGGKSIDHSSAGAPLERVVDIGPGCGTYARLLDPLGDRAGWTAIEIWEPYVRRFRLDTLYGRVEVADARTVDWEGLGPFDLAIAGDVLEHMTEADAAALVGALRRNARFVLLSIPVGHAPQAELEGNPFEAHVEEDWSVARVHAAFGRPAAEARFGDIGVFLYGAGSDDEARLRGAAALGRAAEARPELDEMLSYPAEHLRGRILDLARSRDWLGVEVAARACLMQGAAAGIVDFWLASLLEQGREAEAAWAAAGILRHDSGNVLARRVCP